MSTKWVYPFDEVGEAELLAGSWDGARALLGGKGANLGDMSRLGVPVPPGFTVTTEACNAYLANANQFQAGLWEQELEALRGVEERTGKTFGAIERPLLVSCRSGAKFSMPGMMDTILNIGLNDEVASGLIALTADPRFVCDLPGVRVDRQAPGTALPQHVGHGVHGRTRQAVDPADP